MAFLKKKGYFLRSSILEIFLQFLLFYHPLALKNSPYSQNSVLFLFIPFGFQIELGIRWYVTIIIGDILSRHTEVACEQRNDCSEGRGCGD